MWKRVKRFGANLLIIVGLAILAGVLYQNWHQKQEYANAQQNLREQLPQPQVTHQSASAAPKKTLQKKPAPPREGDALAVLRIPRFGSGFHPVIVEGVASKDLAKGPGHFPGTAMPGETGNFAVAGHRTGWGDPFKRLPELKRGDTIRVEWQGKSYSYHVTQTKVIKPTDAAAANPPTDRHAWITLLTCMDRGWDGKYVNRIVIWGELDKG